MTPALLLAGPPFGGALWTEVARRLSAHGLPAEIYEPLEPPLVEDVIDAAAARLQARLQPGQLVVAHGSAVPLALAAARDRDVRLALSNGPIERLDPALAALSRAPLQVLEKILLRPGLWLRYLASSAGLRRLVVNPYVMDRDTVVAICDPLVRDPARRRALAAYLRELPNLLHRLPPFPGPALLLWGDADPLYPAADLDSARAGLPLSRVEIVPGGRHLHPVERPWAMADALWRWHAAGPTATQMSRSGQFGGAPRPAAGH